MTTWFMDPSLFEPSHQRVITAAAADEEDDDEIARVRVLPFVCPPGHRRADADELDQLARGLSLAARRMTWLGDPDGTLCALEMARAVPEAAALLRRWSRAANIRAFFVVDSLPQGLRDLILVHVGPTYRSRGAICVSEAYHHILRLQHELAVPAGSDVARREREHWLRQLRLVCGFLERQLELRACIHAHRTAHVACGTTDSGLSHRMCRCGGCYFGSSST